jgi:hypothetical protein
LQLLYFLQQAQHFATRLAVALVSVADEPQSIFLRPPLQAQRAILGGTFAYKIRVQGNRAVAPRGAWSGMSIAFRFA